MEFTAKTNAVKATLTINTRIRLALSLTMEEYAVTQCIFERRKANLPVSKAIIYHETGIEQEAIGDIIKSLLAKGIIEEKGDKPKKMYTTLLWNEHFDVEIEFDCEDEEKLGFWQIFLKRGNKQEAKKAYIKARKIVDTETLKTAAIKYIQSKEGEEFKHIMHASTWLNPDSRHWEDEIQVGKMETVAQNTFKGNFYGKG